MNPPRAHWFFGIVKVDSRDSKTINNFAFPELIQIEGRRSGTYWGIRSHVRDYHLRDPIARPSDETVHALAEIPTRLRSLDPDVQMRLINWGYAICDTALRKWVVKGAPAGTLPYSGAPLP